jgi:hypothetical protein
VIVEVWDDEGKEVIGHKRLEFRADYCKCLTWLTLFLYAPGFLEIYDVDGPPSWALQWKIESTPAADKFLLQWAEDLKKKPDRYNFIELKKRLLNARRRKASRRVRASIPAVAPHQAEPLPWDRPPAGSPDRGPRRLS